MTSSNELNDSCSSLAGSSSNQKTPILNSEFLTSEEYDKPSGGLTSYNAVLTSSVESSGGSASEVGATTDLERGDDVSGDAEVRCSSSGGVGTPCDDSACFTHSQCTPDDCCMLESSESCSSLLMEKQNSDADLCKKSSNLELSQSISVLEDSGMSSAGSKKSSCVSGAANSHSHHPVKSSSDSKLAKSAAAAAGGASLNVNVDSLHHHHHHHHHHHYYLSQPGQQVQQPVVPPRCYKPPLSQHHVPEYLQKPVHVDSGVDSSGGCQTPDESPSPVIPPRDREMTPKVMSGPNGTGSNSTNRDLKRFSASQIQKFFQPKPKLPPNANSPQSPIGGPPPPKPKSKPPSPDTDDLYRPSCKASSAYPSSSHSSMTSEDDLRRDQDDDEPRTLVGKKFSRSESCDSEQGALERRPSSSDLATSTDDQSSVTGCNASFDTSGDSLGPSGGESSNSGESCTDNTLTSISGVTFSREVASKLNEEAIKQKNKKVENDDDDLDDDDVDEKEQQKYKDHTYSTVHPTSSFALAPHRELQHRGRPEVQEGTNMTSSAATLDFNRIVENFSTDSVVTTTKSSSSGGPGKKTSRSHHTSSKRSSASKQQHHHQSSSNTHGGPASSSNIKSLHQSSSAKYGNSSSNSSHKLSSNGSSFGASNLNEGLPVKVQPSEPSVVCCQSLDSAKMAVSSLLTIMVSPNQPLRHANVSSGNNSTNVSNTTSSSQSKHQHQHITRQDSSESGADDRSRASVTSSSTSANHKPPSPKTNHSNTSARKQRHSEGGPGGHRKGGREGWYHRYHLSTHGTAPHDYRGAAFSRNQHHHVHYPSERLSSSRAWKAPPKSKDQPVFVFDFPPPPQTSSNFMFAGVNGRGDTSEGGRLGEKGLSKRGGAAAAGVSASSSDTSPDRLSSTSTLKSGSNPPSLSTPQSSSRSTIESPSRTTVLSYGGDTYAQAEDIEMTSTPNKRHYPATPNSSITHGPIFPRIPIKDPLLPIRRGNRGYGFHMKAIKVYSMHSEDFTIQHLVTYVDPAGPAASSGLKENDLITHIRGQSIQGMAHTEVVYLIIQSGDQLLLQATPLAETSIKNECNRRKIAASSTLSGTLSSGVGIFHTTGPNPSSSSGSTTATVFSSTPAGGVTSSGHQTSFAEMQMTSSRETAGTTFHQGTTSSQGGAAKSRKSRSSRGSQAGRSRTSYAATLKQLEIPQLIKPKVSSRDLRNFSQSLGQSNMPPPVGTPSCGTNEGTLSFHPSMGVASPAAAAVASFHTMRRSSYNKTSANSGSSGHGAGVGGSVFEPGVPKQRHHSAHQPPNLSVGVPSVFHAAPPHVGASTAVPYSSACGSSSGASAASASVVTSVMNSPPNAAAAAAPVTPPVFTASPSAAGPSPMTPPSPPSVIKQAASCITSSSPAAAAAILSNIQSSMTSSTPSTTSPGDVIGVVSQGNQPSSKASRTGPSSNSPFASLSHPQSGLSGTGVNQQQQQHVSSVPPGSGGIPSASPPEGSRPQKLPIKYCPKALPSPRRKSGNNMPVSPLARTPSPSRTKSVNASPSLVTSEGGGSGVTVLQRRGGGAITCPPSSVTGGAPSRNLHQQLPSSNNNNVASTTYSSSPSPSPPIKSSESSATQAMAHSSETGGSSSSNSNSRVPCELSPPKFPAPSQDHSCYGYSVPPPVPARQPVTSTASNPPSAGRPSSPIVAPPQVAKPFASSSPAVLRTILPPKSDCNSLTPSSQQSPIPSPSVGGGPFGGTVLPSSTTYCSSSNSGGAAAATSSTIAMQPPATVSICTTSSSCPQIGPFTSPFSSPLQTVHAQSSSLPNSPNIIRVVSSPITSPPNPPNFVVPAHSSASSITTSIGTACSSVASSYNTNPRAGLASLAGSASAGATPVVGIRSAIMCPPPPPSGGKPSVPPRSPSS